MIEKMMDPNIIDYYIIKIENRYLIDFGKPAEQSLSHSNQIRNTLVYPYLLSVSIICGFLVSFRFLVSILGFGIHFHLGLSENKENRMKFNQILHKFIQILILMISNWEKWNGCIFRVIIMWGQGISILWPCKLWWGRATQIVTQSCAGLMTDSFFAHIGCRYIRLRLMLCIQVVTSFERNPMPNPMPFAGTSYQVAISIHLARKVESFWYAVLTIKNNHNEKALELLIFCLWLCNKRTWTPTLSLLITLVYIFIVIRAWQDQFIEWLRTGCAKKACT